MNIIEVKNNLVKLCYEEDLKLSEFVIITDNNKSYLAQVLHLEATRIGKVAIAKMLFNFDGSIKAYDGGIPSLRSDVQIFSSEIFTSSLESSNPLILGKLACEGGNIVVDYSVLNENPIILSEKFYVTRILLNNLAMQLQARDKKLVVFDTAGIFKNNKLTITKDFKLPLNNSTINYIYEKGFTDATAESKAMIQSIFEELSEYSKTVEFIPFDTFKAVVDAEFMRTKLIQLIIMKNKIKQIREWNVFAQSQSEYEVIKSKLETNNTVVFDVSNIKPSLQKECIKYVYSVLKTIDSEFYAFTPIGGESSDKALLSQIYNTENVHTTVICDYDYANLNELKKISKNMIMFSPLKQQKDFGRYNIFLQKLAEDEFIAYGKMTKFVPIIGRLTQISQAEIYVPAVKTTLQQIEQPVVPPAEVQTPPVQEEVAPPASEPERQPEPAEETAPAADAETAETPAEAVTESAPTEEATEGETPADSVTAEEPTTASEDAEVTTEEPTTETPADNVTAEGPVVETAEATEVEEITAPAPEEITTPEVEVTEETPAQAEEPTTAAEDSEAMQALNEAEDIEDEEELSDDDLDMIEKLSKPDEEINAISDTQPVAEESPVAAQPAEEPEYASEEPEYASEEPEYASEEPEYASEEPQYANEDVQNAQMPRQAEPLQTRANTTPKVPEYQAQFPEEDKVFSDALQQGDTIIHEDFGQGVVEKMINYGDKTLVSVNFASVGRRLLNPEITELKKA